MPELPEVETTLRGILPHIDQQAIVNVIIRQYQLRWPIPKNLKKILLSKTIISAERRAKYLLLHTEEGSLIIHLGMSGHLRIFTQDQTAKKHDHIDIVFANQKILRLNDPRRFGAVLWSYEDVYQHPLLKNLGLEPLSSEFNAKYLQAKAKNKKLPIKSFIMDAKVVTGVGNIYAAEALFQAGIHPLAPAQSISLPHLEKLARAIKQILKQAIKRGGTTLKDFVDSNGKPGYFAHQLKVYGRDGKPCVDCQSKLVLIKLGQRATVYCLRCQV